MIRVIKTEVNDDTREVLGVCHSIDEAKQLVYDKYSDLYSDEYFEVESCAVAPNSSKEEWFDMLDACINRVAAVFYKSIENLAPGDNAKGYRNYLNTPSFFLSIQQA